MTARKAKPRRLLVAPESAYNTPMTYVTCWLPLFVDGRLTQKRLHWRARGKLKSESRSVVQSVMGRFATAMRDMDATHVRLTRIAPRKLDDVQLLASLKFVQDSVAELLGRDDAQWKEGALVWDYQQQTLKPRTYGVKVEVWSATNAATSSASM